MLSVIAVLMWSAALPLAAPETPPLIERFLSRVEQPLRSYTGRRVMRATNPRFKKEGWLEADVHFAKAEGLSYRIASSGGSEYVVQRVLQAALEGEAEMWRRGEPQQFGLTAANYDFSAAAAGEDGDRGPLVALAPRRKHHLLLLGTLLLSPEGDLLRIEGRLSKSPSFWVSRVDVVRHYRRMRGVRLPVELESLAHVRIAGPSRMQVQYVYTSINGEPVGRP